MKKLLFLFMVVIFVLVSGFALAGPIEWGGSFTFRVGADPKNLKEVDGPGALADISATLEAQIDETNLLHTSVAGTTGNEVKVGDAYLQSGWLIMTTKLGITDYGTPGCAVTNKEYETKTKATTGAGISAEVPIGNFTIGGAASIENSYGVGVKYSGGFIDTIGAGYIANIVNDELIHAIAGSIKVVIGGLSSGASLRYDDGIFSTGIGAKYDFGVPHIAAGVGVENIESGGGDTADLETKFGADAGIKFDKWGADVAMSYFEEIDAVNVSGWYKPGVVKVKVGYDFKPLEEADEVFIEISADF